MATFDMTTVAFLKTPSGLNVNKSLIPVGGNKNVQNTSFQRTERDRLYPLSKCSALPATRSGKTHVIITSRTGVYVVKLMNHWFDSKKDFGSDKPDTQLLQLLWGIVFTQSIVDHPECYGRFIKGESQEQIFLTQRSHKACSEEPKRETYTPSPHPFYGRFSRPLKKVARVATCNKDVALTQKAYNTTPVKQTKPAPTADKETFHSLGIQLSAIRSGTSWRSNVQGTSARTQIQNCLEVVGNGKAKLTESDTEAAAPKGDKDQDEVDTSTVTSGVSIPVSGPEKAHEALAGPDPKPMKEDQTGSDSGKLHVSLAGPNPEKHGCEFLATSYPKLRVARLEQEMSEVKKTDHFADVLASIRSQVPTAIDNYLRNNYLMFLSLRIKNLKESEGDYQSQKRNMMRRTRFKTFSIRSTDKLILKEFEYKEALSNHNDKRNEDLPWIRKLQTKVKTQEKVDSDDD
ncbi:hypothetical protein Tco_0561038 [Tanacetum coccineum]